MNTNDYFSTPNVHLPIVPLVKKKNYDTNKKFKESWATKVLWVKFYLGSNGNLHVRFEVRWKGRIKSLLLSGILFISMQVGRKLRKTLELMWSRGNCITPKIANHKLFVSHSRQIVAAQLGNGDVGKMGRKVVQICHNIAFLVARTSHVGVWCNEANAWISYNAKN